MDKEKPKLKVISSMEKICFYCKGHYKGEHECMEGELMALLQGTQALLVELLQKTSNIQDSINEIEENGFTLAVEAEEIN